MVLAGCFFCKCFAQILSHAFRINNAFTAIYISLFQFSAEELVVDTLLYLVFGSTVVCGMNETDCNDATWSAYGLLIPKNQCRILNGTVCQI